jgi:serine protease Do
MMAWAGAALAEDASKISVSQDPRPPQVTVAPLPVGSKARSLSLARVSDTMRQGQPWADIMWGRKCLFDNEAAWDSSEQGFSKQAAQERDFHDELVRLGFNVAGDPNDLFKEREDDGADLQVGALITDVSIMACGGWMPGEEKLDLDQARSVGSAQMTVEWQVYAPIESKVVAKIPTTVRLDFKAPQTHLVALMLRSAFAENVRALAASDSFRALVLNPGLALDGPRRPSEATPIPVTLAHGALRPPAQASASAVALFAGDGMGSGFLISREGHVLTNRHVVGAAKYLKVKWADGSETVGEVLRTDIGRDIALVKTDARGREPLVLRRGEVRPGDTVFAIGTPLDPRLQGSLTRGVVSANRFLDGYAFIQSDVVVNPGNSGGPLLDEKGAVVGVAVSGVGQDKAPRGINFFIPIGDALDFLAIKAAP